MSTCGVPVRRRSAMSAGSRCSVCGPKTTSTYGARLTIAAPSWLATQPPTPIIRSGRDRRGKRLTSQIYTLSLHDALPILQRLRTEDHVDVWRAFDDRGAFLARHAAADADNQVGARSERKTPDITDLHSFPTRRSSDLAASADRRPRRRMARV